MERKQEWFNITRVHRNDLIGLGFDGNAVDDATMEHLADLMSKDYVEQLFYLQVGTYAEELGIPRLKEAINGDMKVPQIW